MAPNRVAIVTGGSSGIGRGIALALAEDGYDVAIVGRDEIRVDSTLAELRQVGAPAKRYLGYALDVASENDMREMTAAVLGEFGRIDLLVASAGVGRKAGSDRVMPYSTATLPVDEWEEIIGVNLTGTFLANRAVLPVMLGQRSGHIINICSSTTRHGLRGTPFAAAYCASKFGVVGLTESLAEEVGAHGIRVQAVFPGPVETPLVNKTALAQPFGGIVSAEGFAASVMFLVRQAQDATVEHPHILPFRGGFSGDAA